MGADNTQDIASESTSTPSAEASLLNNIKSRYEGPQVNTDNFQLSGVSPEQQAEMDKLSYMERNPATGPLALTDYYPDVNNPVGVGSYSGSMIGSTTLFAPGGGLVPLGMMDARDKAIQEAAYSKAKEYDAFRKMYQAPTTKLVNIQPEISNEYNKMLQGYTQEAKKKYGSQWAKKLETDQNFLAKNKAFQDLAKYGDSIVEQKAQLDEDIKTGRFIATPSLKTTEKYLMSALDPNNPEFKKIGDRYRSYQLDRDFSQAFNESVDELVQQKLATAGINPDNPDYFTEYKSTKESFTPDQIEATINKLKSIYSGSDFFTPEYIEKNVRQSMAGVRETEDMNVVNKRQGFGDTDYTSSTPETDKSFNFDIDGNISNAHAEFGYNTKSGDQQKELTFALSDKIRDLSGNKLSEQTGNVKGQVQFIGVMPYNTAEKRYYSQEEVKSLKSKGLYYNNHNIKFEPGAIVNTISSAEQKAEGERNTVSVIVPLTDVRGKLSKGFESKIKEVEDKAASLKNVAKPKSYQQGLNDNVKSKDNTGVKKKETMKTKSGITFTVE